MLVLIWPLAWLAGMLVVGALSDWYPYPFLDHREDGALHVVIASAGILVLFLAVLALIAWIDARAKPVLAARLASMSEAIDSTVPPSGTGCAECDEHGRLLVPPAPLRPVRPRRVLRHLPRPARHRPLPRHRPPGDDQLRAG